MSVQRARKASTWLSVFLIVAAGFALILHDGADPSVAPPAVPEAVRGAPDPDPGRDPPLPAPADIPRAAGPSPTAASALPLATTAPAELVAILQARAEAGDPAAACRLALELLDCDLVETLAPEHARPPRDDPHPPPVRAALVERAAQCRLLDPEVRRQAARWLEQAARAGMPEAMLRWGAGEQYARLPDGLFADPAFARWRRDALPMLERAFADGRPRAIELLRQAHADDATLFAGLVADDPERAFAYALLQARLRGDAEPATRLDGDAIARARRLAADWQAGPFAGATADPFAATPVDAEGAWSEPLWSRRLHADATMPCGESGGERR